MWNDKRPIDDYNFYSLLGIVQSGMWLQRDLEKYLQDFGISYGRFSILLSVFESQGETVTGSGLARKLGVSKTTVSKMVEKLIADGFLSCSINQDDRRMAEYALTDEGLKKLGSIIPGYLKRMRLIGANITLEEKKIIMKILNKINFLGGDAVLSQFTERPLCDKAEEIKELCSRGAAGDIDSVMGFLDEAADIPLTRVVDYFLGTVTNIDGMRRIEYYLFNGTQIQRNYSALFFVRINDWRPVNKAYEQGLIDYVQAYSR